MSAIEFFNIHPQLFALTVIMGGIVAVSVANALRGGDR